MKAFAWLEISASAEKFSSSYSWQSSFLFDMVFGFYLKGVICQICLEFKGSSKITQDSYHQSNWQQLLFASYPWL